MNGPLHTIMNLWPVVCVGSLFGPANKLTSHRKSTYSLAILDNWMRLRVLMEDAIVVRSTPYFWFDCVHIMHKVSKGWPMAILCTLQPRTCGWSKPRSALTGCIRTSANMHRTDKWCRCLTSGHKLCKLVSHFDTCTHYCPWNCFNQVFVFNYLP